MRSKQQEVTHRSRSPGPLRHRRGGSPSPVIKSNRHPTIRHGRFFRLRQPRRMSSLVLRTARSCTSVSQQSLRLALAQPRLSALCQEIFRVHHLVSPEPFLVQHSHSHGVFLPIPAAPPIPQSSSVQPMVVRRGSLSATGAGQQRRRLTESLQVSQHSSEYLCAIRLELVRERLYR